MASIEAVMDALESVGAGLGLRTEWGQADSINPPALLVEMPPIEQYRTAMKRGNYAVTFTLVVFVSSAWTRTSVRQLVKYAAVDGAMSIPFAVESDRTLGGVVADAIVTSFDPLGIEEVAAVGYVGGRFEVSVQMGASSG